MPAAFRKVTEVHQVPGLTEPWHSRNAHCQSSLSSRITIFNRSSQQVVHSCINHKASITATTQVPRMAAPRPARNAVPGTGTVELAPSRLLVCIIIPLCVRRCCFLAQTSRGFGFCSLGCPSVPSRCSHPHVALSPVRSIGCNFQQKLWL